MSYNLCMILLKDILKEGNPKLNKVSIDVKLPLSKLVIKKLHEMRKYLLLSQDPNLCEKYKLRAGVGLSAPQIGLNLRFFVLELLDYDKIPYSFGVINPVITKKSKEIIYIPNGEGCLSVEAASKGLTPRYESIVWSGYLYDFVKNEIYPVTMHLSGYVSICFQHEFDHLNGVLFTSKEFTSLPNAKMFLEITKYSCLNEENKKVYGE